MPSLLFSPKKRWQIAYFNSSLDLSCQLTDPTNDVLLQRSNYGKERVPDGKKVTKAGQIFTINNLESSDSGNYECLFVFNGRRFGIRIESIYVTKAMQGSKLLCLSNPRSGKLETLNEADDDVFVNVFQTISKCFK